MRKGERSLYAVRSLLIFALILLPVIPAGTAPRFASANSKNNVQAGSTVSESTSLIAPPSINSPANVEAITKPSIQDAIFSLLPYFREHKLPNTSSTAPAASTTPVTTGPASWQNVKVGSDPNNADQDEPSVAVNPTNESDVIVGLHDFGASFTDPVSAYVSMDGGHSWTGPITMPVPVGGDYTSDSAIAFNRTGVAFFSYLAIRNNFATSDLVVSRSFNGGLSWSAPVVAVKGIPNYSFVDKDYLAIGPDPISSAQDNVYVSYTNFTGFANSRIEFARSTDGGTSWSSSLPISPQMVYPQVVQGSMPAVSNNGTAYVAYYDSTPDGYLYGAQEEKIAISSDGGKTFTAPITMAHMDKELPFQIWPTYFRAASSMFPSISVGPEGNVYAVFGSNPPGPDIADIYFTRSTNGGTIWAAPARVNDDTSTQSQFFPWVAATKNGTVLIIFGDRRRDANNWAYDVYDSVSVDQGVSFDLNKRVTTSAGNATFNYFIGDYFNLAVTNNTAFAVWTDERNLSSKSNDVFIGLGDLTTPSTRTNDPGVPIAGSEPYNCTIARDAGSGGTFHGNTAYSDDSHVYGGYGGPGWLSPDVYYKFNATGNDNYIINTFGSEFFTSLEVRTVCDDPSTSVGFGYTQVFLPNLAQGTYYVILDGAYRGWGPYTLNIKTQLPASLAVNPTSATPGAIVSVTGQGFVPYASFTLYLNGLILMYGFTNFQGNISLNFILPILLPGDYLMQAIDSYGVSAVTDFHVFEAGALQVIVNTTTSFKQGGNAEFYVLTQAKGILVDANLTSAQLFGPGGKSVANLLSSTNHVSTGLYHMSYRIPTSVKVGLYSLVVNANYTTTTQHYNGSSITVFSITATSKATMTGFQMILTSVAIVSFSAIKLRRRQR